MYNTDLINVFSFGVLKQEAILKPEARQKSSILSVTIVFCISVNNPYFSGECLILIYPLIFLLKLYEKQP